MKQLEKKVHFVVEGTSVGCYDSKGNPVQYLMAGGKPYIKLDDSVDRLLHIDGSVTHDCTFDYYTNYSWNSFVEVDLRGVINGHFITSKGEIKRYAERQCSNRELASFYLAMYKAHLNLIKIEGAKHET